MLAASGGCEGTRHAAVGRGLLARLRSSAGALRRELHALALAFGHPATPWYARLALGVVVGYALSPVDLIPDFIPVLGYLDDLVLVPLGLSLALRLVPPAVLAECRAAVRDGLAPGAIARAQRRLRRWGALAVLVGWLALLGAAVCALARLRRGR